MKHRDLIQQLSLEEKAHLLSGRDFWQTQSVKRLGIESMTLSDGPHGIRKQEGAGDQLGLGGSLPATCYPTAATMANSWDPTLGEELGKMLGEEAASQDVCVLLGPGLNIKRRVCIISPMVDEITNYILYELHSGASLNQTIGAYSGQVKKEIITIVDKQEFKALMDYVRKVDPKAFVTVYSVNEIRYQPKVQK